jgi:hypothetical protein
LMPAVTTSVRDLSLIVASDPSPGVGV